VVLITHGGCHLLDDLVACDSVEARKKIVCGSEGGFVRRIVLTPRGSLRATLLERVIELPSLLRKVLAAPNVWGWFVGTPISRRTTR
jgi:hypothetical protein